MRRSDPHRYGVDVRYIVKRSVNTGHWYNVLECVGLLSKTIGVGILAVEMY